MKAKKNRNVTVRAPRQERSRQKVELILEATIRVLEREGMEGLTTNAVAASAGVSIGTLYQYFRNKEAILDALVDREVASMSARVVAAMEDQTIRSARERVAAVVRAVAASYGGRTAAYRLTMAHSLTVGGNRLAPLVSALRTFLSSERQSGQFTAPLDAGDAFVLAHAFRGVLRAMTTDGEDAPPQEAIERSLSRLVVSYLSKRLDTQIGGFELRRRSVLQTDPPEPAKGRKRKNHPACRRTHTAKADRRVSGPTPMAAPGASKPGSGTLRLTSGRGGYERGIAATC